MLSRKLVPLVAHLRTELYILQSYLCKYIYFYMLKFKDNIVVNKQSENKNFLIHI